MAFLQKNSTQGSGTGSFSITIPAATVNNVLIVNIKINSAATTVTSVTDNASTPNTYAKAIGPIVSGNTMYQYYGVQVTGGATTVTVNLSASSTARADVDEFSGGQQTNASVFDVATSNTGASGVSASLATPLAPANNGELISASLAPSVTVSTFVAGTNYTLGVNQNNLASEYRLSGTTSETAPISWTTSANWILVAGAYIPLASSVSVSVSYKTLLGVGNI